MPGSIVAEWLYGVYAAGSAPWYYTATTFAVNIVASSIISKALAPDAPNANNGGANNPGSRAQVPPAGDNKVQIVYGSAYVGGTIVDLSITEDNQNLYYVLALSEVTNTENGNTGDTFTFGDVYFGGKKVIFDGTDQYKVVSLLDESTGLYDTNVAGKLEFYLYSNGSFSGYNTTKTAIQVMQDPNLVYQWDSTKLMSNCAFAIIKITYSQNAGLTNLQQTRFQVINSRHKPGDCFADYLTSARYGAAIPTDSIDYASLDALNAYCDESFTYTTYFGPTSTQTRFRFDGIADPTQTVMQNMQNMASSCDCLIKYNEIQGLWGVIVQTPTVVPVMNINNSNMVSAIQISPIDLSSSYNVAEVKFPDNSAQDSFNSSTFDLAQIDPALLYPNEPVNKQSISLQFVNDSVRAQYLANRFLKAAREDLQLQVEVNYAGLQLEAGDVVTVTNANYGWTNKQFRLNKVVEKFSENGTVTVALSMMEFNAAIYDDVSITQFTPSPNTGIGDPLFFGVLYAPTIASQSPFAAVPSFGIQVRASSNGITQYAEVWYSAYSNPSEAQRIFAGTTQVNPGGNPFTPAEIIGTVNIANIPSGDWYFFVRMVNALGTSIFSSASSVLVWRPTTFQYVNRYLAVAYADNADGTSGFSYNPRGKAYYGLYNNTTANGGTDPTLYTWYSAAVNFGSANYVLYTNRSNRKFSFNVGAAGYLNLGGAFVPLETSIYDSTQWSGLLDPIGTNQSFIDLDARTGQLTIAGATGNNVNDGFLAVTNNTDGSMKVNLHNFLNFGAGVYSKSFNAATLTVDVYGRVVGFTEADNFYYTEQVFNATAGQTSFSFTHTVGWILVFRNGDLLDPSEYTETGTTVVMNTACVVNEKVVIIYMRGNSTSEYYEPLNITIASSGSNTVTYAGLPWNKVQVGDVLAFSDTGSPSLYTVSAVNQTTKVITFTTSISGATAGLTIYRHRPAGSDYAPFTRYDQDVTATTSFLPTEYQIRNGFEFIFVNGVQFSEIDYNVNITTAALDGFPGPLSGKLTVIQFAPNNLAVPASNIANTPTYSVSGQVTYPFNSNPLSMEVYANGCLLTKGSGYDYTAAAASYVLTTAFSNNITLLNQQTFARIGAA
jgi:hypothetical protein